MSDIDSNALNSENILTYVGDFGRYQYFLILLYGYVNYVWNYNYFAPTFMALSPDYKCKIPNNDTEWETDKCHLYYYNGSEKITVECKEWTYSMEFGYKSLIEEVTFFYYI